MATTGHHKQLAREGSDPAGNGLKGPKLSALTLSGSHQPPQSSRRQVGVALGHADVRVSEPVGGL